MTEINKNLNILGADNYRPMCYTIKSYDFLSYEEAFSLKYLSGYITAAIFGVLSWVLMQFGDRFSVLVDMVYPYVVRNSQGILAQWTASIDFCLWQLLLMALAVILLTTVVLMIILKWNPIRWLGWVLAVVSFVFMMHTGLYGLNYYAGDLADDMRLEVSQYTLDELAEATVYYRDKANALADQIPRDNAGNPRFQEFSKLNAQAGEGFHTLAYDRLYPIFAGSTLPVKELGGADFFTSIGVTGVTVGLTGEAAVNPQTPDIMLPFVICREMSQRMCIVSQRDASFGAFLAASVNTSEEFQYSAYFMAFRWCYQALSGLSHSSAQANAQQISDGIGENLRRDMTSTDLFFANNRNGFTAGIADSLRKTYYKVSGDPTGFNPSNEICNLLVNWHIQKVVLPSVAVTEKHFDPYDEHQVDLSGIVNARPAQ